MSPRDMGHPVHGLLVRCELISKIVPVQLSYATLNRTGNFSTRNESTFPSTAWLLLRSATRGGGDAHHYLCAAIQLDILFCTKQDAGGLSHAGILLAWRVVRQQDAGD